MIIGVNAHPINEGVTVEEVAELGVGLVRFPVWLADQSLKVYQRFADGCLDVGAEPIIVVDDRAHAARNLHESYAAFYARLQKYFPRVTRWQTLNETDGLPGTASGPHPASVVSSRLKAAREALGPDVIIYAPGMAGNGSPGGADYLDQVNLAPAKRVGPQIYGAPPSWDWPIPETGYAPLPTVIEPYRRFDKPISVTEIGGPTDLFDNEHQRAQYFSRAFAVLDDLGVAEVVVYCLTASQGELLGLVDGAGNRLESWAAVQGAAKWKAVAP